MRGVGNYQFVLFSTLLFRLLDALHILTQYLHRHIIHQSSARNITPVAVEQFTLLKLFASEVLSLLQGRIFLAQDLPSHKFIP